MITIVESRVSAMRGVRSQILGLKSRERSHEAVSGAITSLKLLYDSLNSYNSYSRKLESKGEQANFDHHIPLVGRASLYALF